MLRASPASGASVSAFVGSGWFSFRIEEDFCCSGLGALDSLLQEFHRGGHRSAREGIGAVKKMDEGSRDMSSSAFLSGGLSQIASESGGLPSIGPSASSGLESGGLPIAGPPASSSGEDKEFVKDSTLAWLTEATEDYAEALTDAILSRPSLDQTVTGSATEEVGSPEQISELAISADRFYFQMKYALGVFESRLADPVPTSSWENRGSGQVAQPPEILASGQGTIFAVEEPFCLQGETQEDRLPLGYVEVAGLPLDHHVGIEENADEELPSVQEVADFLAPERPDVPDVSLESRSDEEYPVFFSDEWVGPDCSHATMVRAFNQIRPPGKFRYCRSFYLYHECLAGDECWGVHGPNDFLRFGYDPVLKTWLKPELSYREMNPRMLASGPGLMQGLEKSRPWVKNASRVEAPSPGPRAGKGAQSSQGSSSSWIAPSWFEDPRPWVKDASPPSEKNQLERALWEFAKGEQTPSKDRTSVGVLCTVKTRVRGSESVEIGSMCSVSTSGGRSLSALNLVRHREVHRSNKAILELENQERGEKFSEYLRRRKASSLDNDFSTVKSEIIRAGMNTPVGGSANVVSPMSSRSAVSSGVFEVTDPKKDHDSDASSVVLSAEDGSSAGSLDVNLPPLVPLDDDLPVEHGTMTREAWESLPAAEQERLAADFWERLDFEEGGLMSDEFVPNQD